MRHVIIILVAAAALVGCNVSNDNRTLRTVGSDQIFKLIDEDNVRDGAKSWDRLIFIDAETDEPYYWVGDLEDAQLMWLDGGKCYKAPMSDASHEEVDCPE